MSIAWVNDVDIETFGLSLESVRGWADSVEYTRQLTSVPGRSGAIAPSLATGQPRTVTMGVLVSAASLAARQTVKDNLDGFLQGEVQLRFSDQSTRYCTGVLTKAPTIPVGDDSSWWLPASRTTLEFVCADGAKYDVTESTVALSSTPADVALGTLPSGGVIVITGPATDPSLTYKTQPGATVGTPMGFTLTLLAGQTLTIDLGLRTIYKDVGGGPVKADTAWTSGDWFAPSSSDGSFRDLLWPTLTLSSGSGVYTYRRAWRS